MARKYAWKTCLFLLCAVPLVFPAGAAADIIGNSNEAVQEAAEPILDNLLAGLIIENYAAYSRDFDVSLKEAISEERFLQITRQIREMFGTYVQREFMGFYNRGQMTAVLWKGKFDKTAEDVLIKLVVSRRGDEHFVTGLWFE